MHVELFLANVAYISHIPHGFHGYIICRNYLIAYIHQIVYSCCCGLETLREITDA